MASNTSAGDEVWPELALAAWKNTYATLHLWTQIVGKIRLMQTPWLNHSWHVTPTDNGQNVSDDYNGADHKQSRITIDSIEHEQRNGDEARTNNVVRNILDASLIIMDTTIMPIAKRNTPPIRKPKSS